jgi:NodT family efflux transporter outer membrane factor (OMF) lipoprotein
LRYILIFLLCTGLAGCISYSNEYGNAQKFDAQSLSYPHRYKISSKVTGFNDHQWWNKFNDPELNQFIEIALHDSPDMRIAEARIRQAEYLAKETGATLWPSVDLSGYAQRERFSAFGLAPPPFNGRTFNISELGLNFNYELDFWGKNREALKAAISTERAAQAEFAQAALVISAAVASTYFQLSSNIFQMQLIHKKWLLDKKLLQITLDRSHHGLLSNIPVNTLQANIQSDKQRLEQYRQAVNQSRDELAVLLGKNPLNTEIQVRKFAFREYHVSLPAFLPAHLLATRPDIDAAKWRACAAAHRINIARARFFPDINLSALFSYQRLGFNNLFLASNQNNFITGAIDLPIFDAGARKANLGQKNAEYDLAVNQYNQTILTALREISDQLSLLKTVNSQLASQRFSVKAAKKNYHLLLLRFHHGIADNTQVIEQQQSLLQQQSYLVALQIQYLQSIVGTYKALGGPNV